MEAIEKFNPSHTAICLDEREREKLYRRKLYPEYKLNRKSKPQEIIDAEDEIIEFCKALNIKYVRIEGNECDDVCGSLQRLCRESEVNHIHVTQDGDLVSLYKDKNFRVAKLTRSSVKLLKTWDNVMQGFKKITVSKPEMVRECLAIQNDVSDNIYGIPKWGKVKSSKIIEEWGSIPNIYDNIDKLDEKVRVVFEKYRERLFLNRKLIKLHEKLDVGNIEDYRFEWCYDKAYEYIVEHGLENKLYSSVENISFDF